MTDMPGFFGPVPVSGEYPPPEIWRHVPVTRIVEGHLKPSMGWRAFVRYPCYTTNRGGEILIGFRYRPRRYLS